MKKSNIMMGVLNRHVFFFVRHLFSGLILLYGGDNIFEIRISKMKIALTIEPHNL